MRFLTNEQFLTFFFEFDAFIFFDIILKLFVEQEPYEFIRTQDDFIKEHRDKIVGLEPCKNHEELVHFLEAQVEIYLKKDREDNEGELTAKGEGLANAFMFFITRVSKKQKVQLAEKLCLDTISAQILFHKRLLTLDK